MTNKLVLTLLAVVLVAAPLAGAKPRGRRPPARPPTPPRVVVASATSPWDRAVAEAARHALGTRAGSVMAMDPHTGRVIAVVNPGLGVERAYQPCSVFKVVVAVAGLSEGVVTPDTLVPCRGGSCWYWPGHGPIDLRRALAGSCNPYFEWVGERLGFETVQRYARLLGLGSPSGINLHGESEGVFPRFVGPAQVGHMSSHAKGIATTAVQIGVVMSALVNGGILYEPRLAPAQGFVPVEKRRLPARWVLAGLYDGFEGAVDEGSAGDAFEPEVAVAGKTGTCAGVGWFASYAPADRPEIVTVVFLRPGNGHAASTVAGRMYRELYDPVRRAGSSEAAAAGRR